MKYFVIKHDWAINGSFFLNLELVCDHWTLLITDGKGASWAFPGRKKVKADIALPGGTPPQSYGTSLAIWDHVVLPSTRHKWTCPPNPSHAGWYSIYLPRRDRRLSWPSWLDSASAGSRTSDLSINHCTTKTEKDRVTNEEVRVRTLQHSYGWHTQWKKTPLAWTCDTNGSPTHTSTGVALGGSGV